MRAKIFFLLAAALIGFQAKADDATGYSACQTSFSDAKALALYGTYGQRSLKSDVDQLQNVNIRLNNGLQLQNNLGQSANRVNNLVDRLGGQLDNSLTSNVQNTYNNNYNTRAILNGALQKYTQALKNAGLDDVISHINSALNTSAQAESYVKSALQDINSLKSRAQQIEYNVKNETRNLSSSLNSQSSELNEGSRTIQQIATALSGPSSLNGYSSPADPYSKLGALERAIQYLDANSCVVTTK